jgi:hypothetical protein
MQINEFSGLRMNRHGAEIRGIHADATRNVARWV